MKHKYRQRKVHRPIFKRRSAPGAPPGILVPDPVAHPTSVRMMAYSASELVEEHKDVLDRVQVLRAQLPVVWLDVVGLATVEIIQQIGDMFALHPLALEDVVNTHQRPKMEAYENCLFIVARMAPLEKEETTEQLAMFLGKDFLITFQERPGDVLDPVRDRIRNARGKLRQEGPDALAYAILDAVIDAYFPLLENYGERLDNLEDAATLHPRPEILARIYDIRRHLVMLRKAVWPLREVTNALSHDPSELVSPEMRIYLRDCYDHTVQILELLETYRELSSGLMEMYLSSVNNRMNEIMKVLTIITAIFAPLSFLAGIYGMNFNRETSPWNMPELNWYYGYPALMGLMFLIALGQLWLFWRKGWFGPSVDLPPSNGTSETPAETPPASSETP